MRFLLVLVPALALAAPKKPNVDAVSEGVVALINKQQRAVMVDVVGKERTWTDSAIAERGTAFPKPIATLMGNPSPARKLEAGKVAKLVESYQLHRDGYEDAKVQRTGPTVSSPQVR